MIRALRRGITLIELLLVLGAVSFLAGVGATQLGQGRQRAHLRAESEALLQAIRETQSRALTAHDGLGWAFACAGTTWQRSSFDASGAEVTRETFALPAPLSCAIAPQPAVRFAKLTGMPDGTATVTVAAPRVGEQRIAVSASGTLTITAL